MEMKHITYNTCPECKSICCQIGFDTGYKGEIRLHTNGERWEYAVFACGRRDGFSPNSLRIETTSPCQNSSKYKKSLDNRIRAYNEVRAVIEGLDVDDTYRETLLGGIRKPLIR